MKNRSSYRQHYFNQAAVQVSRASERHFSVVRLCVQVNALKGSRSPVARKLEAPWALRSDFGRLTGNLEVGDAFIPTSGLSTARGLFAGQARCLRHEVNPFRDAGRPGSRNSVVFDGSFVFSRLFQ
jgi:hypothetical protein